MDRSTRSAVGLILSLLCLQAVAADTVVLTNSAGLEVHVIDTGAIIQRLLVPDRSGELGDIVAGFDNPEDYANNTYSPYFGAVVGRVANRIAGATFKLDGERYNVPANDKGNALHGGSSGWSVKTWNLSSWPSTLGDAARLTYTSPDGDEGFPGTVEAAVTYTLTNDSELIIDFEATSDAPTPINLAQHSYFNLDVPSANSTILDQLLFINGSYVTPTNSLLIPTGEFEPVEGTPYDFQEFETIGSRLFQIDSDPVGYDINYVLWDRNGSEVLSATRDCVAFSTPQLAAVAYSQASGRVMELSTQAPGLQFYSGNNLNGSLIGKDEQAYPQYGAFALETQMFPDFVNQPDFPGCILRPGNVYNYTTILKFFIQAPNMAVAG